MRRPLTASFPGVQGVIKAYDPITRTGSLLRDTDLAEVELSIDALDGSVMRMLRQGQRVNFTLNAAGQATGVCFGSEVDMATPGVPMPPSDPT